MDSVTLALLVLAAGGAILTCYGIVRFADTLFRHRGDLSREAAEFNARTTARRLPHTWIVDPPTRTERAVYAAAERISPRWRRRRTSARATRHAMGEVG